MDNLRIGLLLGVRQIQRTSRWTTLLVIAVMMFTFLNLIAISGVLIGLPEGVEREFKKYFSGDLLVSPHDKEYRIENSEEIRRELLAYPEVSSISTRYLGRAIVEADFKERRDLTQKPDTAQILVTGIDPEIEDATTDLSSLLVEGEFLENDDEGKIILGSNYIKRYTVQFEKVLETIEDARPGDKVLLSVGEVTKEFEVKGILESKVDNLSLNSYITEREFRRLFGRADLDADMLVVRLHNPKSDEAVKATMLADGLGTDAKIETAEESLPQFLDDIKETFGLLAALFGSISIVVASITIFIIIFISVLARQRHIGILKGIGIEGRAIQVAYIIQASFYSLVGSFFGALITYLFLVPYFLAHPFDFPLSNGIIVAEPMASFYKFLALFIITLISGLLPAWMIVRQNTLNSILGRK